MLRDRLKAVWYCLFSVPPTYLAGRAAMALMSERQVEWFRREFFCQTRTFSKPVHVLGRLVRAVESYDFGRKSDAERARETFDFWSGDSGYRWHVDRHNQIPEQLRLHQNECLAFLAGERFARVIEIGGGNALFLRRLQEVRPDAKYIGVDINAQIIERARMTYPDIELVTGDVFDYLRGQASLADTLVVSRWTSVFFTESQMKDLLAMIRQRGGTAYFSENHYHKLGAGVLSQYSGARKNSHDYPALMRDAGMTIKKEAHYQPIGEGGLVRVLGA